MQKMFKVQFTLKNAFQIELEWDHRLGTFYDFCETNFIYRTFNRMQLKHNKAFCGGYPCVIKQQGLRPAVNLDNS